MPELEGKIDARLTIWGVECTIFGGMLIEAELHVKGFLDAGDGSGDLYEHAIAGGVAGDLEATRFREANYGIVLILAGAKARGEIFDGEKVAIGRAGGIVEILEEIFELGLMTEREHEVEFHGFGSGETAERCGLSIDYFVARVARQQRLRLSER